MKTSAARNGRWNAIYSTIKRFFFPVLVILWCVAFIFAKIPSSPRLRGARPPGEGEAKKFSALQHSDIDHVIVVAGHAVMNLELLSSADQSDSAWYLLPYQRDQSFPEIITSHVKTGIDIARFDRKSLLVFSGGQTRHDVGPTSEGASYYYLARHNNWIDGLENRVVLEEYARDSFENLLFSICRFQEVSGVYPKRVTVVGFDFKKARFSQLHRHAIGFPVENFTYVGLKPLSEKFDHDRAVSGELNAVESFKKDQYGCNDPELLKKRISRNPFHRTIPYQLSCPEIHSLLVWCGPNLFDTSTLPWNI